jgi:hypothetical protein
MKEELMPASRHVLACATVIEEMLPLLPADASYQTLDFGLHINPASLKRELQNAIDRTPADTIILGYGFFSMAVIETISTHSTLVVPQVDDCIAIFKGSSRACRQQALAEPGTYYLTKDWLEVADTPFDEYHRLAETCGPQRAERLILGMIKHYTRLALIDTGRNGLEAYRTRVQTLAERWGLRYEEIPGSNALVRKMIFGPWDDDFVVVPPGETIRYDHFFPSD